MSNAPAAKQGGTPPYGPGEEHPHHILTAGQVLDIYASDAPVKDLADRYGVNRNTISMIRHGKRWGWLTQAENASASDVS